MGPITGLSEFLGMLRRRGPVMAAVLVVGLYLAMAHALSLPRAASVLPRRLVIMITYLR